MHVLPDPKHPATFDHVYQFRATATSITSDKQIHFIPSKILVNQYHIRLTSIIYMYCMHVA